MIELDSSDLYEYCKERYDVLFKRERVKDDE
jgi:hypothetical protein